jgi:hypothetical protein
MEGGMAGDGAARAPRQCFDPARITNFRADGTHTLYVKSINRDVYELQAAGGCNDLNSTFEIALTPMVGLGRLCSGDTARLTIPNNTGPQAPCHVRVVRALTAEQAEALPERVRP